MPAATIERTPLYEEHLRLHAQMTNFGGWAMPLQYSSIREEHLLRWAGIRPAATGQTGEVTDGKGESERGPSA